MRILFLTQFFQPEPFLKGLPFIQRLKENGHEVEVLTGYPNYPGGKVYPGYKMRLFKRETLEGVKINRVALLASHDRSGLKRIITYLSFAFSTFLLGPLLVRKPDVVYVYNLISLSFTATLLKKLYHCKIVYDIQDLWPESVISSKMLPNRNLLNIIGKWCDWAYLQADMISVLSPGFKTALIRRGVPAERIEVVYNWYANETFTFNKKRDNCFAQKYSLKETFNVVFAGTMGISQGLDTILEAARICLHDIQDLRFVLVGGGTEIERLKVKAKQLKLKNVVFIPYQSIEEMHKIFSLADALLVHLVDAPLYRITIPSKTQAYLTTGIPILMAVRGDAASLLSKAGSGFTCAPENPIELLAIIKRLYDMPVAGRRQMGQQGKQFYEKFLSLDRGTKKFLCLLAQLER